MTEVYAACRYEGIDEGESVLSVHASIEGARAACARAGNPAPGVAGRLTYSKPLLWRPTYFEDDVDDPDEYREGVEYADVGTSTYIVRTWEVLP